MTDRKGCGRKKGPYVAVLEVTETVSEISIIALGKQSESPTKDTELGRLNFDLSSILFSFSVTFLVRVCPQLSS